MVGPPCALVWVFLLRFSVWNLFQGVSHDGYLTAHSTIVPTMCGKCENRGMVFMMPCELAMVNPCLGTGEKTLNVDNGGGFFFSI